VYRGTDLQTVLNDLHVKADMHVAPSVPVLYIHRQMADADIYFLTNQSDSSINIPATFRVSAKQPELWNPVTGEVRLLPDYKQDSTGTEVRLQFQPSQSWFVVFRHPVSGNSHGEVNFPKPDTILSIQGPWQVAFDHKMRGPSAPVVFDSLYDWSQSKQDSIRYYSGTAIYRNSFTLNKIPDGAQVFLNLGRVQVLAHVSINGKDMGGAWTDPWQVDVTSALKQGANTVEVRVVNLWVNRLIGDSRLPASERKTWASIQPYKPDSPLEVSGLLGPVTLQSVRYDK
jgi:hypothetical protein